MSRDITQFPSDFSARCFISTTETMTIPAQASGLLSPSLESMPGPFEGPEKLLEIWFAPSLDSLPTPAESSSSAVQRAAREEHVGLRRVPREVWEEMLDIVKCKVLSVVAGDDIDAYLLR